MADVSNVPPITGYFFTKWRNLRHLQRHSVSIQYFWRTMDQDVSSPGMHCGCKHRPQREITSSIHTPDFWEMSCCKMTVLTKENFHCKVIILTIWNFLILFLALHAGSKKWNTILTNWLTLSFLLNSTIEDGNSASVDLDCVCSRIWISLPLLKLYCLSRDEKPAMLCFNS